MHTVHWLSPDEFDEWDCFVSSHPLGLIYHLSSWKQALENAFGHIRGQFLVLRDGNGQILAGLPVYSVTSLLLGNRTVSVPFATMCDPLVSTGEQFNLLWPAIEQAAQKLKSRRIEIRTMHVNSDCMPALLTPGQKYKHHILSLADPVDVLFNRFNKSNICKAILKATREGVVVEEGRSEKDLRVFHSFLVVSRRKHLLPPMPFAFFNSMYSSLGPERVAFYLAMYSGKPVGGMLVSKFNGLCTAEYLGTAENSIRGVSSALYWKAIQCAKSSGAKGFSFGRTSCDNMGLLGYKRRWAVTEEDLTDFISCPGAAPALEPATCDSGRPAVYETAIKLVMRFAPAPVQKLVGDFCYHHLG